MENRRIDEFENKIEDKKIDIELKLVKVHSKLNAILLLIEKKIRKLEPLTTDHRLNDRQQHIKSDKYAALRALASYINAHDTYSHDARLSDLNNVLKDNPFYKESKISAQFSTTKQYVDKVKKLAEEYLSLKSKLKFIKEDIRNIAEIYNIHQENSVILKAHGFFPSDDSRTHVVSGEFNKTTPEDKTHDGYYSFHHLTSS